VEELVGTAEVLSAPGRGTTVRVELLREAREAALGSTVVTAPATVAPVTEAAPANAAGRGAG